MTIAIGFMLGYGAVLCADSQEVVGDYAKTTTQKIQTLHAPGKWRIALVGAGDAACIELCNEEVMRKIGALTAFDYQKMVDILRSTIREIHEQHVWPRQAADRPWFSMLIALQGIDPAARALFFTQDSIVLPVDHYKSIGVGSYLADYLHDRIYPTPGWDYKSTPEEVARNAIFILDEVKSAIQGCDGETIVAIFNGDGTFRWVIGSEVEQIEGWFDEFHNSSTLLRSLFSRPDISDEDFNRELLQFNANMKLLRARQSKDAETHTRRYAEFIKAQKKAFKSASKQSTSGKSKQVQ
jgi:20S proteasome alpha/beta subunit